MGLARLIQLAFVYGLCAFYSFTVTLRLIYEFLKAPRQFFYLKPRPTPPPVLTDPEWHHARIQLSDVTLHYVQAGDPDKPLMLFVHGFPEFWYSWRHQMRFFKRHYRVVALDNRGYGDSDKPAGVASYEIEKLYGDLKELIEALGYKNCILVAHDWGGAIAWMLAIKHPELVRRFIVCNCPHPTAFRKAIQGGSLKQFLKSWYMFFFQAPILPELMIRARDLAQIEAMFRKPPMGTRNANAFTDEDIEAWKYTFQQPGNLTGPINYYRASLTRDPAKDPRATTKPAKVRPPTLIIWGTGDGAIEASTAEGSGAYCENLTVRYIQGASHWVQNDEPELVNQYIDMFLNSDPNH